MLGIDIYVETIQYSYLCDYDNASYGMVLLCQNTKLYVEKMFYILNLTVQLNFCSNLKIWLLKYATFSCEALYTLIRKTSGVASCENFCLSKL